VSTDVPMWLKLEVDVAWGHVLDGFYSTTSAYKRLTKSIP